MSGLKRVSDAPASPSRKRLALPVPSPSKLAIVSPAAQRSPTKPRRGITLAQKQALIENIQLEITERARRLRAQYNLQAQGLRSRVEIRINRIPMALRKVKMGDLVRKYAEQLRQQERLKQRQHEREQRERELRERGKQIKPSGSSRPPPVPPKDYPRNASPLKMLIPAQGARILKRTSESFDKENDAFENPKKRPRGTPAAAAAQEHVQALSPASSNSRLAPRDRNEKDMIKMPPPTSHLANFPARPTTAAASRPASPVKSTLAQASRPGAAGMLASMVERAKATRGTAARKPTMSSTTSSSGTSAAGRTTRRGVPSAAPTRKGAATAASTATTGRSNKRVSDSSDGSTSTVIKKSAARTGTGTTASTTAKRTVLGTIRKGVAGATGKKAAAPSGVGSTRVLRRRG